MPRWHRTAAVANRRAGCQPAPHRASVSTFMSRTLLQVLVVRALSGAAGRANRRYAAILSPAAVRAASVVDVVQDFLEVFPGFALGFLIVLAQQVRGVVGDHHRDFLPLEPLAAHLGDAFLVAGEGAGGDDAERADEFGADRQKLPVEELAADLHFVRFGIAILRRTALHHVGDVNVLAEDLDAFLLRRIFDHLGEQLSGPADERDALRGVIGAGAFADEDQRGLRVADAEDDLIAGFPEAAAAAIAYVLDDFEERIVGGAERRKIHGNGDGDGSKVGSRGTLRIRLPHQHHWGRLAIEGLDAQILVELEILAEKFSVHWRRGARGAGSGLRRKCGRRWRAWTREARQCSRRCAG